MLMASGALYFVPPEHTSIVRTNVTDLLVKGTQRITAEIKERWNWDLLPKSEVAEESSAVSMVTVGTDVRLAKLAEEVQRLKQLAAVPDLGSGSVNQGLKQIQATVVSRGSLKDGIRPLIAWNAEAHSIEPENAIVIQTIGEQSMSENAMVSEGRVLLGKLADAGQDVCRVVPVTDRSFRAPVELIRVTGGQAEFYATGVLEGIGDGFGSVKFIESNLPVQAGDLVVTSREEAFSQHLICGVITEADLPDGEPHWSIQMRPLLDWRTCREVNVLGVPSEAPLQITDQ
ncbi:Cell shape-determining protein MreC [Calycomorphotria hydatis]|uniref:Cell shape-determining protein MreC n=2 Tax=Calycomorphotria hydatis TaxID=2528027 RepID=A0A517TB02_9PLAN|nr:Cell shape-determining protein MreC [Calycomorphotria hydatis]